MSSNVFLTEKEVRKAYAKLLKLTQGSAPPEGKREKVEEQTKILNDFMWQNARTTCAKSELEAYAEMAITEGHIELFEKVCDWCKLGLVQQQAELGPWRQCFLWLYWTLDFRCTQSITLATRLATSKYYIKAVELGMRSNINNEQQLIIPLQNNLYHLSMVPAALGYFRGLYPLILEIYKFKRTEQVRVPALLILSLLSTEKEAKDLINESSLSLLVGFLGKSVRNQLPMENTAWAHSRRTMIIRTLENMITADERIIATLVKLDLLAFLGKSLDAPLDMDRTKELRVIITCLWTLSENPEALQRMASDKSLVIAIERCSTQFDQEQAVPAKKILKSIQRQATVKAGKSNTNNTTAKRLSTGASKTPTQAITEEEVQQVYAKLRDLRKESASHGTKREESTTRNANETGAIALKAGAQAATLPTSTKAVEPIPAASNVAVLKVGSNRKESYAGDNPQLVPRVGDEATPVFISYQSVFTERVLKIKRALEARGIPCWMATENMVGNVQDAIGDALMVAPAIIICFSHSYRDSVYCKVEANAALRWKIPMVACCVEEGYEADYWLGVVTAPAPGFDCSTDEKLNRSLDRIEKELRAAHRVIKSEVQVQSHPVSAIIKEQEVEVKTENTVAPAIQQSNSSLSDSQNASAILKKQNFDNWDTNQVAQWLKSLSLYDCIPQENRSLINGPFLKEMRIMKHDLPNEFTKSLAEVFNFNVASSIKFRAELETLE